MGLTAEMAGKSPNSTQVSIMGKKHRTKWGHVPARHGLITPEGVHLQEWTTLMGTRPGESSPMWPVAVFYGEHDVQNHEMK